MTEAVRSRCESGGLLFPNFHDDILIKSLLI